MLTGGGDCPGLNAVIRAVAKTAINEFHFVAFPIAEAVARQKFVPLDSDIIQTAFGLDINLGNSREKIEKWKDSRSRGLDEAADRMTT